MLKEITYDCPNCLIHYDVWVYGMGELSPQRYSALRKVTDKQETIGTCKRCVSTTGVKTSFEMDGLFTKEDLHNRFYIMTNCLKCNAWTKQDSRIGKEMICGECGHNKYDIKSQCSIRTFNPTRKKISKKDQPKGYS